ncbi:MAG: ABC transporter ATP-binding protein [SAR324 cluster bacterium]|nr:ABC transporter ATP-binding protein [SAR324 cluster bacterium]
MTDPVLLKVKNLVTAFDVESGVIHAVENVSFDVKSGKTLGIVGESGCGKSVTSLSIMRLLPKPSGYVVSGEILLDKLDLLKLPPQEMRKIRGNRISMIFQEPMTALNPVHRIGKQIREALHLHHSEMSDALILQESVALLRKVGIPAPEQRINEYPHQLSGGMRQRVMIAIALACRPEILIADEPTTALDVTIQAQILELMKSLQKESGMSIIFITHDLGVIAEMCDEVVVMYAGKVAEKANVLDLFKFPRHPYTKGLMASIPNLDMPPKEKLQTIEGVVPELTALPPGCRFQNRCVFQIPRCHAISPPLEQVHENHFVSCFRWQEIEAKTNSH